MAKTVETVPKWFPLSLPTPEGVGNGWVVELILEYILPAIPSDGENG